MVELLVVIAIIVILVSLVMPSLSSARMSAARIACTGNQKQIGLAIASYAQDYKDQIPLHSVSIWWNSWQYNHEFASGYLKLRQSSLPAQYRRPGNILECPADRPYCSSCHIGYVDNSYIYNWRITRLKSTHMILLDGIGTWSITTSSAPSYVLPRHIGRTNILYGDLHVSDIRRYPASNLGTDYWGN
jgi:prepilin-type processing-associated H-X9-DG protein